MRDGPKSSVAATTVSSPANGARAGSTGNGKTAEVAVAKEHEEEEEAGGVFVIGDDGSEASEVCCWRDDLRLNLFIFCCSTLERGAISACRQGWLFGEGPGSSTWASACFVAVRRL